MDSEEGGPDARREGAQEAAASPGDGAGDRTTRTRRAAIGAGAVAAAAVVVGGGAALAERAGLFGGGLTIKVNGRDHQVAADPSTPLLYVLRNEMGLQGPRFGCGLSECGACTVQLDGHAVRSCVTTVSSVAGRAVTTLEGLGTAAHPHPLQKAFIDQQAVQCGYCISGMIMESEAFLRSKPKPSDADIKNALAGHLCRCGTHYRIVRAVKQAARLL
jgi:nicotinate dehydrogenase subunit A